MSSGGSGGSYHMLAAGRATWQPIMSFVAELLRQSTLEPSLGCNKRTYVTPYRDLDGDRPSPYDLMIDKPSISVAAGEWSSSRTEFTA